MILFSLNSKPNLCRFFLSFVYNSIVVGRCNYQEGRGWDPIDRFNPATVLYLSQTRTWIYNIFYVQSFEMKGDCFVHICCIVDYHCLSFLYISKILYIWLFMSEWLLFNTKLTIFQLHVYQSFDDKFLFNETNICDL